MTSSKIATQRSLTVGDQVIAALGKADVGRAAGGDQNHVGGVCKHLRSVDKTTGANINPPRLDLPGQPIGDTDHVLAPAGPGRQQDLAAETGAGLKQGHLVAAQGRDPRRLHARRAAADYRDAQGRLGRGDVVGQGQFAAGGDVVDAKRVAAAVDAVDAIARADAGPDAVSLAALQLGDNMRVGHMGPREARHIDHAFADGPVGGGWVRQARGLEHGEAAGLAHPARQFDVRGRGEGHAGKVLGQGNTFMGADAAFVALVGGKADTENEVVADLGAGRVEHLHEEPGAVLQTAAVVVGPVVRQRRQELAHEMGRGEDFAAVEPAFAAAPGGIGKGACNPGDIPRRHLEGHRAMGGITDRAWRHGRQPVPRRPAGAPPHMGDLAHQAGTMAVNALGELAEQRNNAVVADIDLAVDRARIPAHVRRAAEHGQADAALGLFLVIGLIARAGLAAIGIARRVGCG